jgi:hypothetical protein
MAEISLKTINQTGLIITLSREIESLMTQLGATEAGLHDKTDHLAPQLTEECIKLLHYIAAVRNKNAHEVTDNEELDMEFFTASCQAVMNELRQLIAQKQNIEVELNVVPQVHYKVENIEEKFKYEFQAMMRICAYLPFLNVFYFLYRIFSELIKAATSIAGIVFFLMSVIIITGSLLEKNYQYFYLGLILFGGVYAYGVILALMQRQKSLRFSGFAYIPFLNFGYFIYGSYCRMKVVSFIYCLLALILCFGAFFAYYKFDKPFYALHFAWINYVMGFVGVVSDTISSNIARKNAARNSNKAQ